MTRQQALQAILVGIELADQAAADHVTAVGVGEMGIGNTTTSSAVLCALTGAAVADVTGRGGGVNEEGFRPEKAGHRRGAGKAPAQRGGPGGCAAEGWRL